MSKSYRKEVLKRLQQELDATTDTKEIIRIGNAIAKLTKPKRPIGRPPQKRPPEATPSGNKTSSLVAKWADRLSHVPEEQRIMESIILECEARGRSRGIGFDPPSTESRALLAEVMGMVSAEERAILNERPPEVA